MKIYYGLNEFGNVKNPVVTTGTFDGVHLGHRKIINRLKEISLKIGGETVILSFSPHPRLVLFPEDNNLKLLSSDSEKTKLLAEAGVAHLIIHPFTKEFSRLSSAEYVRDVLVNKIGTKKLVIGYNHQFGRNREGSFEHLKEFGFSYGFEVEEIPALDLDNVNISSTKIREALIRGDISTAARYLGYNYSITGKVVQSSKTGRTIGFPTANIVPCERLKMIPSDGVYAVEVFHKGAELKGMMNIGVKPTVTEQNKRTIEVHIFDFNKDIYDQELTVVFRKRLREEKKFSSLEGLKAQLEIDKTSALDSFS